MKTEAFMSVLISSFIFAFPRKFPTKLYTNLKRLFKKKRKTDGDSDAFTNNFDSNNPEEVQLEKDFRRACKIVANSPSLSVEQSLEFYGLYKQSLFGNCTLPLPDPENVEKFKKWEAWEERRGLTSSGAKKEYIRLVEIFTPNFRNGQENDELVAGDEEDIFMTDEEYNKRRIEDAGNEKKSMALPFSKPIMGQGIVPTSLQEDIIVEEDVVNFMCLIDDNELETMESIIKRGFDLGKTDASGMMPIHYAIENENEEAFELLSKHYKDLDVPDSTGMTPLHYAVTHENKKIIEILLQKKVDIYKQDNDGESPIDVASSQIKKFIESSLGVKLE